MFSQSHTVQFPIEKVSKEQFVKKIARVLYRPDKFFFFDGKLLQRLTVSATKRFGTIRSGRLNVVTKKLKTRAKNCSHPRKNETCVKENLF